MIPLSSIPMGTPSLSRRLSAVHSNWDKVLRLLVALWALRLSERLRGQEIQTLFCHSARGSALPGAAQRVTSGTRQRTGERLGGGFRWREVSDKVDARRRWKRPFDFPILSCPKTPIVSVWQRESA